MTAPAVSQGGWCAVLLATAVVVVAAPAAAQAPADAGLLDGGTARSKLDAARSPQANSMDAAAARKPAPPDAAAARKPAALDAGAAPPNAADAALSDAADAARAPARADAWTSAPPPPRTLTVPPGTLAAPALTAPPGTLAAPALTVSPGTLAAPEPSEPVGPPAQPAPATEPPPSALLSLADEAMTTLQYQRGRDLAQRAVLHGGLSHDELTRAHALIGVSSAQLDDAEAAKRAFLRLFALQPESNVATRLAPARRGGVLEARGFWSLHPDGFGLDVSYVRRARQLLVRVRDPIQWARTVHVWWRFADRPFVKTSLPVEPELVVGLDELQPADALEAYVFVVDEHENVLMQFGREHDPRLFAPSEEELATMLRRDIRGGQTGSYARRLEEFGVQVALHGYLSVELKPEGERDVASFDLHHATAMIRAQLGRVTSVEVALEWEHLGREQGDFYMPHAFLDARIRDQLVVRGGFFEVPVGAFNEYLYPDFLRVTGLPPLFSREVVPALWSEVGLQARGRFELARAGYFTYAAFVVNGLEQRDAEPTDGVLEAGGSIRSMRFNARDRWSGDKAVGGRLGVELGELDIGVSGYSGRYTIEGKYRLSMFDADFSFRSRLLTVRSEGAVAFQDTPTELLRKYGLYGLVALRPSPYLEPYFQYDLVNVAARLHRTLLGFAIYPVPRERETRNLRLKCEAGFEFPEGSDYGLVWFLQLTTGF